MEQPSIRNTWRELTFPLVNPLPDRLSFGALVSQGQAVPSLALNPAVQQLSDIQKKSFFDGQDALSLLLPDEHAKQCEVLQAYFEGRPLPLYETRFQTGRQAEHRTVREMLTPTERSRPKKFERTLRWITRTGQPSDNLHFGMLTIREANVGRVRSLLESLERRNPNLTRQLLAKVMNAPDKIRVTPNRSRMSMMIPNVSDILRDVPIVGSIVNAPVLRDIFSERQVLVDDSIQGRSFDDVVVPPDIALAHELFGHAPYDRSAQLFLMGIPHPTKTNAEEARVIDGIEAAYRPPTQAEVQIARQYKPRFHASHAYPQQGIVGEVAFTIQRDGERARFSSGETVSGTIVGLTPRRLTLKTNKDATIGEGHHIKFSIPELCCASSGLVGSAALFKTSPLSIRDIASDYLKTLAKWTAARYRGDSMRIAVDQSGLLRLNRTVASNRAHRSANF